MKNKILIILICLVLLFTVVVSQINSFNVEHILEDGFNNHTCSICILIEAAMMFLSIFDSNILWFIVLYLFAKIKRKFKKIKQYIRNIYTLISLKVQLNN